MQTDPLSYVATRFPTSALNPFTSPIINQLPSFYNPSPWYYQPPIYGYQPYSPYPYGWNGPAYPMTASPFFPGAYPNYSIGAPFIGSQGGFVPTVPFGGFAGQPTFGGF